MGSKLKCPSCGAKNDFSSRRCRMCTAVINPDAPERQPDAPAPVAGPIGSDHFDADVINRQVQGARSRFGGGGGALAARIAAANGGQIPTSPPTPAPLDRQPPAATAPWSDESLPDGGFTAGFATQPDGGFTTGFDAEPAAETSPGPYTAPPVDRDEEPFDPDALFRDIS